MVCPADLRKKATKEGASAETTTTAERYKARAKNVRRRECIQITSASSGFQRKLIFFMICIKIFLHACFFQRLVVFLFLRRSSRLFSQTEERKRVPSPCVWGGAGSDRSIQGGRGGLCCACVATCRGRKKRSHGQADNNNTAKERGRDRHGTRTHNGDGGDDDDDGLCCAFSLVVFCSCPSHFLCKPAILPSVHHTTTAPGRVTSAALTHIESRSRRV